MSAQALLRPTASGFTFARGRGVIGGGGAFAPSQPRGGRAPPTNGLSFSSSKYSTSGLTRSRRNPLASPSKNSRSVGGSFVASAVAGGESLESQRQKQQTQHDDVGEEAATTADVVNNILPKEWPNNRAGFLKKKIRVQIIKNITLDVEPDATLHDVKAMIEYQENIPAEDQLLYFAQKQLPDDLPVTHSNIPRKSTLVMRLRATRVAESLKLGEEIFVQTFAGTTVTLAFNPTATVGDVRATLASRKGVKDVVEASDLRLLFAGETLDDDDCMLADYGVQRDSTLFLDRTMRISVKDPYVTVSVGDEDDEDKEASLVADEVIALDVLSSNTVGDVLDMIAAERGIERNKVKLTDGKSSRPIRGFYRVLAEGGTLADCGLDENTDFVLEQMLTIRVADLGECVDLWTYEDLDAIFCKLVQKCPEKLAGKYNTASAFLSGCEQTKLEVLRSLTFRN